MKKCISLMSFFLVFSQLLRGSTSEEVEKAIQTGDATAICKHFVDNVDLQILDKEDVYSKSQAELILKDFFAKHPVKSFKIMHKSVSKGDNQYSIGLLETYNGKFRIYFLMKNNLFKLLVSQFRIETENE